MKKIKINTVERSIFGLTLFPDLILFTIPLFYLRNESEQV